MNAWETEFIASLETKNESRAIEILRSGFPVTYQIRSRDTQRNVLPGYTYPLLFSVELELYELSRFLLLSGAPVNSIDCLGQTALLIAAFVGSIDLIRMLLSYRADIAIRDFAGNTILHMAAMRSHLNIIKFCIEDLKFPVIVQNRKGELAIDIARKNQENSKSLQETEKIQQVIEYLWRVQEEFKRERGKRFEQHNSYMVKHPKFSLQGLAKVSLVPSETGNSSPQARRTLETYLNSKHTMIFKSYTAKEKTTIASRMATGARSTSPFSK